MENVLEVVPIMFLGFNLYLLGEVNSNSKLVLRFSISSVVVCNLIFLSKCQNSKKLKQYTCNMIKLD